MIEHFGSLKEIESDLKHLLGSIKKAGDFDNIVESLSKRVYINITINIILQGMGKIKRLYSTKSKELNQF